MTLLERFDAKFVRGSDAECWMWTAGLRGGYGGIKVGRTVRLAHRVAYELYIGPIPEGLCVCHHCDVRTCVNPAHLFLGTNADNVVDRNFKNRQARGEKIGRAKLTETKVLEIRAAEGLSQRRLAASYGVSLSLISYIRNGKSWAHVL